MFLDLSIHQYDKDITPFIKNGIIIDTSVIKILIDGIISTRISGKKLTEFPDFKNLLDFLDMINVNNKWDRFFITPHILTEVCTHLRNDYNKHLNYKEIVEEVLPILKSMGERLVTKDSIISLIDFKNPIIEVGDISIFVATEDFVNTVKKIAILANDWKLNKRYEDNKNVLVMDYQATILNCL